MGSIAEMSEHLLSGPHPGSTKSRSPKPTSHVERLKYCKSLHSHFWSLLSHRRSSVTPVYWPRLALGMQMLYNMSAPQCITLSCMTCHPLFRSVSTVLLSMQPHGCILYCPCYPCCLCVCLSLISTAIVLLILSWYWGLHPSTYISWAGGNVSPTQQLSTPVPYLNPSAI